MELKELDIKKHVSGWVGVDKNRQKGSEKHGRVRLWTCGRLVIAVMLHV